MKRASVDSFPAGTQGAGMITNVTVGPSSVSRLATNTVVTI